MLSNDTIIKVKSRASGTVGYRIPEMHGLKRSFSKGEIKEVTFEEIKKLSYLPGGQVLLKEYLIINEPEVLKELGIQVEPEYFYTEAEVKNLLEKGSIEQFLDCLDFAPQGTLDIVKDLAVKLEINDIRKREAIKEKMGFNVTKAIEFNKEVEDDTVQTETKLRRTKPVSSAELPVVNIPAPPTRRYTYTTPQN